MSVFYTWLSQAIKTSPFALVFKQVDSYEQAYSPTIWHVATYSIYTPCDTAAEVSYATYSPAPR
jgi:hypothetical protein